MAIIYGVYVIYHIKIEPFQLIPFLCCCCFFASYIDATSFPWQTLEVCPYILMRSILQVDFFLFNSVLRTCAEPFFCISVFEIYPLGSKRTFSL